MQFSNRTVLVTGAGSGIGEAIAKMFAKEGAKVILHDITLSAQKVADDIGGRFLSADLSDMSQVRQLAKDALEATGGKIDILVNNAGFQHISPVEDFDEAMWAKMIQVMLISPFQLIKYVVPGMKAQRWGRIINVASTHGIVASPFKSAYISAKHGMIGLTKTIALEVGEFGITVNAICPAYVKTPLVVNQIADQARTQNLREDEVIEKVMLAPASIKRLIEPSEVAAFAQYLASENGGIMTGAAHLLDLGWTAR